MHDTTGIGIAAAAAAVRVTGTHRRSDGHPFSGHVTGVAHDIGMALASFEGNKVAYDRGLPARTHTSISRQEAQGWPCGP